MTNASTSTDKANIAAALEVLQLFRSIDPNMPIGAARSFLLIAAEQGMSVGDLKARSGSGLSAASRYHGYLGASDRKQRPGKGLVAAPRSLDDARRKRLKLTPDGRRLLGQVTTILDRPNPL